MSARGVRAGAVAWLAAMMVLGLAGCSVLPAKQSVAASTYVLAWSGSLAMSPQPPAQPCLTLLVSVPRAAPGFETPAMAYVEQAYRLDYFADHRWVDAPARMLAPLLVQALDRTGLFGAVFAGVAPIETNLKIDTELLRLQQVFEGKHSVVELSVRVDLINLAKRRLVASRRFDVREPAPQNGPYGGVIAANRAVGQLLSQLGSFLSQEMARGVLRCPG